MPFIGELAAVATSICFSIGPTYFTIAGHLVGSVVVNRTRLVVAFIYLTIAHTILYGIPLPFDAEPDRWFWLSLSGVVGFVLGDAALFQAFITIGTRLTMLVFAISPVISALLAWFFLEETLTPLQILGMAITLSGVAWVVAERENRDKETLSKRDYGWGLFLGMIAAAGQAGGIFTAKLGLYGDFPALSGQIIRMLAAMVAIWLMALVSRQVKATVEKFFSQPKAVRYILLASFIGPAVGVWFSLVSIQHTSLGVASTLMALPPVFLIPIGYFVFKERISLRAIVGTLVTMGGVAVLFLA
ncbi:MAG: DMT family transporter [Anaerolineales bacterium]|jgi:drug/metabolite transporter (DMT)-like permease